MLIRLKSKARKIINASIAANKTRINDSETIKPRPGNTMLTPPPLATKIIVKPIIKIVSNAAMIVSKMNIMRIFRLYRLCLKSV